MTDLVNAMCDDVLKQIFIYSLSNASFQASRVCKRWHKLFGECLHIQSHIDVERVILLIKHFASCTINHRTVVRLTACQWMFKDTNMDEMILTYDRPAPEWTLINDDPYCESYWYWKEIRVILLKFVGQYFPGYICKSEILRVMISHTTADLSWNNIGEIIDIESAADFPCVKGEPKKFSFDFGEAAIQLRRPYVREKFSKKMKFEDRGLMPGPKICIIV